MDVGTVSLNTLMEQMDCLQHYAQNEKTLDPEAQQTFSLFLQNLKACLDSSHSLIESDRFTHLCDKICKIEKSFSIPEELLKTICNLARKILPPHPSNSSLNFHNVYNASSSLLHSCLHISETLNWLFIDGQHEWKQQKYELVLKSIIQAFKEENVDLTKTYTELKALNPDSLSTLQKMTLNWLDPLLAPSNNLKDTYRQFISNLRAACRYLLSHEQKQLLENSHDPLVLLTSKACYYRFNEVHMYTFSEKLVALMIQDGMKNLHPENPEAPQDVFSLTLKQQFEAIRAASHQLKEPQIWSLAQKGSASTNLWYDPQLKSNIPYVLCDVTLTSQHPLRILRMGTPTNSAEGVTPEYRLFLHYCQQKNEKVFYASEQAENSWVEGSRNQQIRQLSKDFPGTFFMIVLPNDTPFYHQAAPFNSPLQTFQDFKEAFKHQIQSPQGGFYFDQSWLEHPTFSRRIEECLNEIHEDIFSQNSLLSLEQRLDFIEIVYARIILEMICFLKLEQHALIKFLFLICRDDNDRAVKSKVTLVSLCLLYLGIFSTPESQKMLKVFTHAPKMMVMKTEMNERRERLISVLETLSKPEAMLRLRLRQTTHQIVTDFKLNS
jgi:hypothetical protein